MEVKPSTNPFFQTVASDIGVNTKEKVEWSYDVNPSLVETEAYVNDGTFSFLYKRTSDDIGGKVAKPTSDVHKIPTRTEFLKKRREELMSSAAADTIRANRKTVEVPKPTVDQILTVYKHETKVEDPRYNTTSNDIGLKAPTAATFVSERAARNQGFSKSFLGLKPSSSGLNTGLTKSTVHPSLDPQFV